MSSFWASLQDFIMTIHSSQNIRMRHPHCNAQHATTGRQCRQLQTCHTADWGQFHSSQRHGDHTISTGLHSAYCCMQLGTRDTGQGGQGEWGMLQGHPFTFLPFQLTSQFSSLVPVFNISLTRGCLHCGSSCLHAVQAAVPVCVAAGLLDVGPCNILTLCLSTCSNAFFLPAMVQCVRNVIGAASSCRECLSSLICCVTDSCK